MSLADVILRSETLLKKYERYDGGHAGPREKSDDPFDDEYTLLMDKIQDLHLRAEQIALEKNRALKAAMNADLRKTKQLMMEEAVPLLEQLARGGKKGKMPPSMLEERMRKVEEIRALIEDVPDGVHAAGTRRPQRAFNGAASSRAGEITIDSSAMDGRQANADYYKHTEESAAFQAEWQAAKQRQDAQLESIETGLGTLKEIGAAMNEELQRHDVLIDEADDKMDAVTKELQNNNMRLKGLVTKVRKGRNFVIDVILICVLCAIGLYIYNMLK